MGKTAGFGVCVLGGNGFGRASIYIAAVGRGTLIPVQGPRSGAQFSQDGYRFVGRDGRWTSDAALRPSMAGAITPFPGGYQ